MSTAVSSSGPVDEHGNDAWIWRELLGDDALTAAGWDESQHPRDAHGKFDDGGGEANPSWDTAVSMVKDANKGTPYGTKDPEVHKASTTTDHPRYFYHGSKTKNRESIQEHGLEANRSLGGKMQRVYLAEEDPHSEPRMDTAPRDTWLVDTEGLPLRPDPELPGKWAISEHDIPVERLKLLATTHPDGLPDDLTAAGHDVSDQPRDSHGRFGEGEGSDAPAGWRADPYPDDPRMAAVYRAPFVTVSFSTEANISPERQRQVLGYIAAVKDADPIAHQVKFDVLAPGEMRSKNAGGETFTHQNGASVIELNAKTWESPPVKADTVYKRVGGDYAEYVVTHEYGHALMNGKDADLEHPEDLRAWKERGKMMRDSEPPSPYGNIRLTNHQEAYAEAYTDWRRSPEPGELATKLAAHEGWGKR